MKAPTQLTRNRRIKAMACGPRTGQAFVLFAAGLIVIAAACVFTIDVGLIYFSRARLQNAADAGALAAAHKLIELRNTGEAEEMARYGASQEAQDMVAANWDEAGWQVTFGGYSGGQFVEHGDDTPATAVKVVTTRDEESPGGALGLFFGPILGFDVVDISTTGGCKVSAGIRLIRGTGNLLPFAVDEDDVAGPGETMLIYDKDKDTPGNFGLLNFDGGSNNTPELQDWILYGYPGEVGIDPATGYVIIEGTPGWRSAIKSAVEERIGQLVFVLVYDQVTEQGANAEYRIVRFLALTLTELKLKGNSLDYIAGEVEREVAVPNGETDDSFDDNLAKIHLSS